ncbi:MAG: exosortase F system-associated protein [Flavobacteriaceae bacterium]|nr:exosortase F system-associated protein [Flavobacteriaceae bacterium]
MKIWKYGLILILIMGLFMVRYFQEFLFYDPLLRFFETDFSKQSFPEINLISHLGSILLRYGINMLLSLGIIHLLFNDVRITKVSSLIFGFLLLILIPIYYYFIHTEFSQLFTAGFYVRRLLIQPLMLLVLVPAIWYYKKGRSLEL